MLEDRMLSSSGLGRGDWIKLQKEQAKAKVSCWDQVNLASASEMAVGSWWVAWSGTPGNHACDNKHLKSRRNSAHWQGNQ